MLALPEDDGKHMLHADASKYAVGVVRPQNWQDGQTILLAGGRRKLMNAETQYRTYDSELLAIHD